MSFFDDPIFAGIAAPRTTSLPVSDTGIKQSVGKVELSSTQQDQFTDDAPKIRSWDGFWADPVFADITSRERRPPPGKEREFFKYEVDDSVSVASLFPQLASSAFGQVSFRKTAVEWWSKPILDKPAGLYLRTEIEFNGLLDEVFQIFRHFLGETAKPTLRLSAYLGVARVPDGSYASTGLTLSGSLLGLRTPLPPVVEVVTILSVGVELNVGRTNDVAEIESPTAPAKSPDLSFSVFGQLHAGFPGLTGPILLDYRATLNEKLMRFDMSIPGGEEWQSPLGVEGLKLQDARFVVNVPVSTTGIAGSDDGAPQGGSQVGGSGQPSSSEKRSRSKDPIDKDPSGGDSSSKESGSKIPTQAQLDASTYFAVTAKWKTSGSGVIGLKGSVYKQYPDSSYLEGTIEKVTWSDIKGLFSDLYGSKPEPSEHEITCEKLTLRVSKAQILLTGGLTVNGRYLASATIAISSAGLLVQANVKEWKIDDGYITINDASLTLMIGGATTPSTDEKKNSKSVAAPAKSWNGGVSVAGTLTIREGVSKPITIKVDLTVGRQAGQWFWVICGIMDSDLSLRDFVSSVEEDSERKDSSCGPLWVKFPFSRQEIP